MARDEDVKRLAEMIGSASFQIPAGSVTIKDAMLHAYLSSRIEMGLVSPTAAIVEVTKWLDKIARAILEMGEFRASSAEERETAAILDHAAGDMADKAAPITRRQKLGLDP